jgi:tetratricopeptide (TPR) repeat protein
VLRGRAALDAGDAAAAIESLSKVADLDTNPEGLASLFHAYLRSKRFDEAGSLATKLASVHNNSAAIGEYADALLEAQEYRGALTVYSEHADELLRSDPVKFSESVRAIIGHVQDDPQALETVLALLQKSGENTHLSEVYELMAHAYVQSNDLEKARDCYLRLMQMEPANQIHAQNYQQVLGKMGTPDAPRQITAEEGSALVEELEATAPFIEQHYSDEIAMAVRAALTDAELFISYNMAQKALPPLLGALPKAPRDLRVNQKLAALYTRAGKFTEAAVFCRTLESVYRDAGHSEEASRYSDIAAKYEERSAGTVAVAQSQEIPATEAAAGPATPEFEISAPVNEGFGEVAEAPAAPPPAPAKPSAPRGVFFHASTAPISPPAPPIQAEQTSVPPAALPQEQPAEVDLSSDWESELSVEAPEAEIQQAEAPQSELPVMAQPAEPEPEVKATQAAPASAINLEDGIEEVRFYLGQGMTDHAEKALAKLEALAPGSPELAVLRLGIESAKQQAENKAATPEVAIEEAMPSYEAPAVVEEAPVSPVSTPQPWPQEPPHVAAEPPILQQMVSDLEQSLGSGFLPEAEPTKPEPVAEAAVSGDQQFRSGTLDEFVSDLEASLGSDFAPEAPVGQAEIPVAQVHRPAPQVSAAASPVAHVDAPVARAAAASAMPMASTPAAVTPPAIHPPVAVNTGASNSAVDFAPGVDLSDMFGELKHELEEETTAADEDPETHYNLGVAFREMGLLDEAIGEFQKVCLAAEHGRAFSQLMQTYTWLAQCFLDKGIPEAAIRWYEQALKLPSIDQETRTALHYELASSFENAGNKPAALSNFLEVYGSNIDYRDVAERIKALRP